MTDVRKPFYSDLLYYMPWVAVGFAYRLWRASLQLVMFRDETTFAYQIKHIVGGSFLSDSSFNTFPPAYALICAPVALITGDPEFAGRLVTCALGAATAIPAFYLARDLFSYRTAAVAAALTALYPTLVSTGVMAESAFGFWLVLGMYLGNRAAASNGRLWYALFGLVMAVSYLTRPEGFFVFFAYLAVMAVLLIASGADKRSALVLPAISLAFFMLLAFPYMLQLRAHFGSWEISGKTRINLAKVKALETLEEGENVDEKIDRTYEEFREDRRGLAGDFVQELGAVSRRYRENVPKELAELANLGGYPLIAFFFAGLFFTMRADGRLARLGLLCAALVPLALFPMVMVLSRVLMPYIPFLIVFGSFGMTSLSELAAGRLDGRHRAIALNACLVALAAVALAGVSGRFSTESDTAKILARNPGYRFNYSLRQAGEGLRPLIKPGSGIICRMNMLAYYAGGEYVYLPNTDVEGLIELAAKRNARYLFFGQAEGQTRPQLLAVLVNGGTPVEYPAGDGSMRLIYGNEDFLFYEFTGLR